MRKIFAAVSVALVTLPIATFACGGGDCGGMELPPPPAPTPGAMDNLLGLLSGHAGLMTGIALAALLAALAARRNKPQAAGSAAPSFLRGTS